MVLVTGLSGGGKASVLRELEDLGYEAVDNPPLPMLEDMVSRSERNLAIGVDARTRGFDADLLLAAIRAAARQPRARPELVFTWADETTLLRRYTETRRRHPLAPQGRVADGIAREEALTAPLREGADLVIDTSDLPLGSLRRLIDQHFGAGSEAEESRLVVSLISFAYKFGLPREADLVFDARFLRNPHYDPMLQRADGSGRRGWRLHRSGPRLRDILRQDGGLDRNALAEVRPRGQEIRGDHDWVYRWAASLGLSGRKTRASSGGPDRRGPGAQRQGLGWRLLVTHRELAREGLEAAYLTDRLMPAAGDASEFDDAAATAAPVQAQEA